MQPVFSADIFQNLQNTALLLNVHLVTGVLLNQPSHEESLSAWHVAAISISFSVLAFGTLAGLFLFFWCKSRTANDSSMIFRPSLKRPDSDDSAQTDSEPKPKIAESLKTVRSAPNQMFAAQKHRSSKQRSEILKSGKRSITVPSATLQSGGAEHSLFITSSKQMVWSTGVHTSTLCSANWPWASNTFISPGRTSSAENGEESSTSFFSIAKAIQKLDEEIKKPSSSQSTKKPIAKTTENKNEKDAKSGDSVDNSVVKTPFATQTNDSLASEYFFLSNASEPSEMESLGFDVPEAAAGDQRFDSIVSSRMFHYPDGRRIDAHLLFTRDTALMNSVTAATVLAPMEERTSIASSTMPQITRDSIATSLDVSDAVETCSTAKIVPKSNEKMVLMNLETSEVQELSGTGVDNQYPGPVDIIETEDLELSPPTLYGTEVDFHDRLQNDSNSSMID